MTFKFKILTVLVILSSLLALNSTARTHRAADGKSQTSKRIFKLHDEIKEELKGFSEAAGKISNQKNFFENMEAYAKGDRSKDFYEGLGKVVEISGTDAGNFSFYGKQLVSSTARLLLTMGDSGNKNCIEKSPMLEDKQRKLEKKLYAASNLKLDNDVNKGKFYMLASELTLHLGNHATQVTLASMGCFVKSSL